MPADEFRYLDSGRERASVVERVTSSPDAPLTGARVDDAIAIVGIGCRFPGGVDGPESYLSLLRAGTRTCVAIPAERWDRDQFWSAQTEPGKMAARRASLLHDVASFDAEFFSVSRREAARMDPQHRVALEVAWEAVEDAGAGGLQIRGSKTGVFVGIMNNDFGPTLLGEQLEGADPYYFTGNAHSFLPGRIAYHLGTRGPTMAIDTACSSSLVAVHLAVQSLRAGECNLALAGGVSLILRPTISIVLTQAGALAPDGESKAFDERADGMGRGEGAGFVVLKPLSAAARDRDQIYAIIRGSAVNHCGAGSGITVPSGPAQQELIHSALCAAGVRGEQVGYLEAHGTGTRIGDPIEVRAAVAALRDAAPEEPLVLGSVKANIGHLDAAAGIAGLIKVALALRAREHFPQCNFERGNPEIPWDAAALKICLQVTPWNPNELGQRLAGVSSFGMSGVNAHAVLEGAPPATPDTDHFPGSVLLPLSATSAASLLDTARAYRDFLLSSRAVALSDITYSAGSRRRHHAHRLAVIGADHEDLAQRLDAFIGGQADHGGVVGCCEPQAAMRTGIVLGDGISPSALDWSELLRTSASFRAAVERCDAAFARRGAATFAQLLEDPALNPSETRSRQFSLSVHLGLIEMWRDAGLEPDALLGQGVGELSAVLVAGMLSLDDAVAIVLRQDRMHARDAVQVVDDSAAPQRSQPVPARVFSAQLGAAVSEAELASSGWQLQAAEDNFERALEAARMQGIGHFVELWAHSSAETSARLIRAGVAASSPGCARIAGPHELRSHMLAQVGALFVDGLALRPVARGRVVSLPRYAWNREQFSAYAAKTETRRPQLQGFLRQSPIELVSGQTVFPAAACVQTHPFLAEHKVNGRVVFPAAGYLELVAEAFGEAGTGVRIEGLALERAMRLREGAPQELQLFVESTAESRAVIVYGRNVVNGKPAGWTAYARMRVTGQEKMSGPMLSDIEQYAAIRSLAGPLRLRRLQRRCARQLSAEQHYAVLEQIGMSYGPAFRTVLGLRFNDREVLAQIRTSREPTGFRWDPTLVDGCLQATVHLGLSDTGHYVPAHIDSIELRRLPTADVFCHAVREQRTEDSIVASVRMLDASGNLLLEARGVRLQRVDRRQVGPGLYVKRWRPQVLPPTAAGGAQRWLVLFPGALGRRIVAGARTQGIDVTVLEQGAAFGRHAGGFVVRPDHAEDLGRAVAELLAQPGRFSALLSLAAVDAEPAVSIFELSERTQARVESAYHDLLAALRSLVTAAQGTLPRLVVVTSGVQHVAGAAAGRPELAGLFGAAKAIGLEYPGLGPLCVDLDPEASPEACAAELARELTADASEDEVAYRARERYVARLVREPAPPERATGPLHADGCYIVSGGLGGIGLAIAAWLVGRGARRVALLSRSGGSAQAAEALQRLRAADAEIRVLRCDVGDVESVRSTIALLRAELGPIRGVVHAAGELRDATLAGLAWTDFMALVRTKLVGAIALHLSTLQDPVDLFVMCSSVTALVGNVGQVSYAAANAMLDGLALQRASMGLPALSLAYGAWREVGMLAGNGKLEASLQARGFVGMTTAQAIAGLEAALALALPHVGVFTFDAARHVTAHTARARSGYLSELLASEREAPAPEPSVAPAAAAMPRAQLTTLTMQLLAKTLDADPQRLSADATFDSFGLDSMMALEFKEALEQSLGCPVQLSTLWSHPTCARLAAHLSGDSQVGKSEAAQGPAVDFRALADLSNAVLAGSQPTTSDT